MSPADFKRARNALGLTQLQLGRRIGEPRARVGRIERGKAPITAELAGKIVRVLTEGTHKP